MDPAYEVKGDYRQVIRTLQSVLPWLVKRWGEQDPGQYRVEVLVGE
jgi:23S rRNA A2030 N6-methylase RlmJ